jgi:hypothetical protein
MRFPRSDHGVAASHAVLGRRKRTLQAPAHGATSLAFGIARPRRALRSENT